MRIFVQGQEIQALGRPWVVVMTAPGVDMLIADPLLTDEEHDKIRRANEISEKRRMATISGVIVARAVLEFSEIDS